MAAEVLLDVLFSDWKETATPDGAPLKRQLFVGSTRDPGKNA
jgi:hypothetical protein